MWHPFILIKRMPSQAVRLQVTIRGADSNSPPWPGVGIGVAGDKAVSNTLNEDLEHQGKDWIAEKLNPSTLLGQAACNLSRLPGSPVVHLHLKLWRSNRHRTPTNQRLKDLD